MYVMSVCDDGGIRKLNSYERGLETAVSLPAANSANTSRGRFFIAAQSYTLAGELTGIRGYDYKTDEPDFTPDGGVRKDVASKWTVTGTTRRTHRDLGADGRTDRVLPARLSDYSRARRGQGAQSPAVAIHCRAITSAGSSIKGGAEAVQWSRIVVVDGLELPPRRWTGGGGLGRERGLRPGVRWTVVGERYVENPGRGAG
jgi:hypothetical protein